MSKGKHRLQRLYAYLQENRIDAAVLVDFEGFRNRSVRYLSGHPQDALLIVFPGEELLVPWDVPLARDTAWVDRIVPFLEYDRSRIKAVAEILKNYRRIELSAQFTYPEVRELQAVMNRTEILCRADGLDRLLAAWRSIKDEGEIARLRQACSITDQLIDHCRQLIEADASPPLSEVQLALEIENKALQLGADRLGFESLILGPKRSFAIHPFPAYTDGPFGTPGTSIVDFGIMVAGYTSDVTFTFCRGPLSVKQEAMITAVRDAYQLALSLLAPGVLLSEVARTVTESFDRRGFRMPHHLGHCIGLDAHELPYLSRRRQDEVPLQQGMVMAVEPGLYDPECGGVRWENDILCTDIGVEVLTRAQIFAIDR